MCAEVVDTPMVIISRPGIKEVEFWVEEYVLGSLEASGNNWSSKNGTSFLKW